MIEYLQEKRDDELYEMLGIESIADEFGSSRQSRENLIKIGRSVFVKKLGIVKRTLCGHPAVVALTRDRQADATVLLGVVIAVLIQHEAFSSDPTKLHNELTIFSVLVIRHGLARVCEDEID
jgi:hypothetical protein